MLLVLFCQKLWQSLILSLFLIHSKSGPLGFFLGHHGVELGIEISVRLMLELLGFVWHWSQVLSCCCRDQALGGRRRTAQRLSDVHQVFHFNGAVGRHRAVVPRPSGISSSSRVQLLRGFLHQRRLLRFLVQHDSLPEIFRVLVSIIAHQTPRRIHDILLRRPSQPFAIQRVNNIS